MLVALPKRPAPSFVLCGENCLVCRFPGNPVDNLLTEPNALITALAHLYIFLHCVMLNARSSVTAASQTGEFHNATL
jgi:hypothetical protein